jgi:hypothetical protein
VHKHHHTITQAVITESTRSNCIAATIVSNENRIRTRAKKKEKGVQAGHRNQEAAQAHHKDGEKIIWPENPNLVLEE